jgi:hypothetical protein
MRKFRLFSFNFFCCCCVHFTSYTTFNLQSNHPLVIIFYLPIATINDIYSLYCLFTHTEHQCSFFFFGEESTRIKREQIFFDSQCVVVFIESHIQSTHRKSESTLVVYSRDYHENIFFSSRFNRISSKATKSNNNLPINLLSSFYRGSNNERQQHNSSLIVGNKSSSCCHILMMSMTFIKC